VLFRFWLTKFVTVVISVSLALAAWDALARGIGRIQYGSDILWGGIAGVVAASISLYWVRKRRCGPLNER
jgi:hypothetical protein